MTTLELFKKHRKGEVSRERFLYEVRRDNNLPWVTNTTSYDDAVKILKNKGIIRESAVTPENTLTSPAADRVNPYFLKKGIEKELENKADLNNNSYEEALNKAANKLAKDPHAFDDLLIHNASDIHKKDEKLAMKPVKGGNHIDKDNATTKMKGQETLKAMSAPTKENRKGKPKNVKIMPDKGVEGSEKIIKEISAYLKKKLRLDEGDEHEFHEGMAIPMEEGDGIVKEINGGTLCIEMPDGSLVDMQINQARHIIEQSKLQQHERETGKKQEYESGYDQANQLRESTYTLTSNLNKIQSQISTSSTIDIENKMAALGIWNEISAAVNEEDWGFALDSLEELDALVQQIIPEEYERYYFNLFEDSIAELESLYSQSNEELDEDSEKTRALKKTADTARLNYLQSQVDDIKAGKQIS